MSKKILKTNEAAAYLGVSRSSLTNWVKKGLLGSGTTPGGHYRFTHAELDAFAERRGLIIQKNRSDEASTGILVIDDDESFREFVREALEVFSGFELREASDGVQGALMVGTWLPDLIILDLRMPNMNGVEFLKMLKSDPKTHDLKIVVASAHLSPSARKEIDFHGVDFILEKPVRLAKLVATVERVTNLTIL